MDVRDFENAIEGRDVVSNNNSVYSTFVQLYKPVYDTANKLTGYADMSQTSYNNFWTIRNGLAMPIWKRTLPMWLTILTRI